MSDLHLQVATSPYLHGSPCAVNKASNETLTSSKTKLTASTPTSHSPDKSLVSTTLWVPGHLWLLPTKKITQGGVRVWLAKTAV